MKNTYEDLHRSVRQILDSASEPLRGEIESCSKDRPEWVETSAKVLRGLVPPPPLPTAKAAAAHDFEYESIVLRVGRPVLFIKHDEAQLKFDNPEAQVWQQDLKRAEKGLTAVIPAIGRVEVRNHPLGLDYLGTGWVVADGVIVTNRHVARELAEMGSNGYVFSMGFDRRLPIESRLDFLEEYGVSASREFPVAEVLFIAPDDGPDVAFLRLGNPSVQRLPTPVQLARALAASRTVVATIGYPARDPRIPEQELMDRLFGGVYDKKRLAPGFITGTELGNLLHDCTTLGGNSGSAIVALPGGEVVGLHFSGSFLRTNYAVPATVVADLLRELREAPISQRPRDPVSGTPARLPPPGPAVAAGQVGTSLQIPIEVTVQVGGGNAARLTTSTTISAAGTPIAPGATPPPPLATRTAADPNQVARAVRYAKEQLVSRADVVAVKPGYRFRDGWITGERAVVVCVRQKLTNEALALRGILPVPTEYLGVPVDVTTADPLDFPQLSESIALEGAHGWVSNYKLKPNLPLDPVDEMISVTVHAGPDAGWPVLEGFLQATQKSLTIGMYDFTAQHILQAVEGAVKKQGRTLKLVIQEGESLDGETKKDDIPDETVVQDLVQALGGRFDWAYASVKGPGRLFDSAYHIKVAVRDGKALWLSSGNWQSSNQPPFDPIKDGDEKPPLIQRYNREWHVVLEHDGLAQLYEEYLKLDLTESRATYEGLVSEPETELWVPVDWFQPSADELEAVTRYTPPLMVKRRVKVQPILTPDNYAEHALKLIDSAKERICFQNQSFAPLAENAPHFEDLLSALQSKQRAGLDVRIIFRSFPGTREKLTAIQEFGFDTSREKLRLQKNCHTKGIIVDGKRVLVGSHNWTNAGTKFNRDASLLFDDEEIARYYERLFEYDWRRIGGSRVDESIPAVEIVRQGDPRTRPGYVRMGLSEL